MAKSIKVNPNILECNEFTTDKLKQLVVPQGCFVTRKPLVTKF